MLGDGSALGDLNLYNDNVQEFLIEGVFGHEYLHEDKQAFNIYRVTSSRLPIARIEKSACRGVRFQQEFHLGRWRCIGIWICCLLVSPLCPTLATIEHRSSTRSNAVRASRD